MRKRIRREIAFVCVAVLLGLILSIKPWRLYFEQRSQIGRNETETQRLQESTADLVREKARVGSAVGKEELARQQGFKKPGEVSAEDFSNSSGKKKVRGQTTRSPLSLQGEG